MMTLYPAGDAPHWSEFPFPVRIRIFWIALQAMTWKPWLWSQSQKNVCIDLPSAWWLACHAWSYVERESDEIIQVREEQ